MTKNIVLLLLLIEVLVGLCFGSTSLPTWSDPITSSREPLFNTIVRYVSENNEVVIKNIKSFLDDTSLTTNEEYVQQIRPYLDLLDRFEPDEEMLMSLAEPQCERCKNVVMFLQLLLKFQSYEELEWPIIQFCYEIETDITDFVRRQEFCNGTVTIQGPHVAVVINSSSAEKICQFQNACPMPPLTDFAEISRRLINTKIPSQVNKSPNLQRKSTKGQRSKEANIIKVAQLTDIHVDNKYASGSLIDCGLPSCCWQQYGPGNAGPYGDYRCNIPPRTVELFLKQVASNIKPNFLLYSGDISGTRTWDETQEEVLNCTSTVVNLLENNLQGYRTFPCFGNHEMFPTNLYYRGLPDVVALTDKLTEWWAPIANFTPDQQATMKKGGYYSSLIQPGLRIITYNSNYLYTLNWYNILNDNDRMEMITFLVGELERAKVNTEKVILVGHHPTNSGDYLIRFAHLYKQLVLNYSDTIVLQLAGHRHSDEFHLISDDTGAAKSIMYLAGPVTTGGTKNPSMRVYHLDATTFELIDYEQYYLNLRTINSTGGVEPEVEVLYSAKSEYNLTDLRPQSWSRLVDRMESDNELLLHHYNYVFIDARVDLQCDHDCRVNHLCRLRHCTYDEYLACLTANVTNTTPQDTIQVTTAEAISRAYISSSKLTLIVWTFTSVVLSLNVMWH